MEAGPPVAERCGVAGLDLAGPAPPSAHRWDRWLAWPPRPPPVSRRQCWKRVEGGGPLFRPATGGTQSRVTPVEPDRGGRQSRARSRWRSGRPRSFVSDEEAAVGCWKTMGRRTMSGVVGPLFAAAGSHRRRRRRRRQRGTATPHSHPATCSTPSTLPGWCGEAASETTTMTTGRRGWASVPLRTA